MYQYSEMKYVRIKHLPKDVYRKISAKRRASLRPIDLSVDGHEFVCECSSEKMAKLIVKALNKMEG